MFTNLIELIGPDAFVDVVEYFVESKITGPSGSLSRINLNCFAVGVAVILNLPLYGVSTTSMNEFVPTGLLDPICEGSK